MSECSANTIVLHGVSDTLLTNDTGIQFTDFFQRSTAVREDERFGIFLAAILDDRIFGKSELHGIIAVALLHAMPEKENNGHENQQQYHQNNGNPFLFLHLDLHQDRSFLQENTYIYYSCAII